MASSICATNWSWATAKYAAPIAQPTAQCGALSTSGGQPHPIRLVGTAYDLHSAPCARVPLGAELFMKVVSVIVGVLTKCSATMAPP